MKRFEGKVITVTGATSGLGRNAAVAFAAEGAKVVAAARREEQGQRTVEMIQEAGGEGVFVSTDVGNSADIQRMVNTAVETYGGLDLAYNCAGISGEGWANPAADYPESTWHEVIATNLTSIFLCMKYQIPEMLKRGGGAIVNMASVAGLVGTPGGVGYVATKHGVVGITKAAALEYAPRGISINAVAPGVVYNEMLEEGIKQVPDLEADMIQRHPIGRLGQMEEVTRTVMWLCSGEAPFLMGQTLTIDGGYTIA